MNQLIYLIFSPRTYNLIMPTTRNLRSKALVSDFVDDTDEFEAADEDPFAVSSSFKMEFNSHCPFLFECDVTLPDEGIEIFNKAFLLQLLDIDGGPAANNRKTRLLSKYSKLYPDRFGVPKSERYVRTKWLMDRWKRDKSFHATRASIMADASRLSRYENAPDMPLSSSFLQQETSPVATTKKQPASKKKPSTRGNPESPPVIKKKSNKALKTMFDFSSPVRFVKGFGKKKGKTSLACLQWPTSTLVASYTTTVLVVTIKQRILRPIRLIWTTSPSMVILLSDSLPTRVLTTR